MDVWVDAAGEDVKPARVDLRVRGHAQVAADGADPAVDDGDVAWAGNLFRQHDRSVANDQVRVSHPVLWGGRRTRGSGGWARKDCSSGCGTARAPRRVPQPRKPRRPAYARGAVWTGPQAPDPRQSGPPARRRGPAPAAGAAPHCHILDPAWP